MMKISADYSLQVSTNVGKKKGKRKAKAGQKKKERLRLFKTRVMEASISSIWVAPLGCGRIH